MIIERNMTNSGQLYVVATPIGNLGDMTHRAIEILTEVDLILAEDTRVSQKLLKHYGINTKLSAFHDHNEAKQASSIIEQIDSGRNIALISDAGTPLISDPGFKLIRACREAGIIVTPIPGPSACVTAMSVSGLPCDKFTFYGFLPTQEKAKLEILNEIEQLTHTVILYESPRRVLGLLEQLKEILEPTRMITIARELTKRFETVRTDTLEQLYQWYAEDLEQHQGEFVILIGGKVEVEKSEVDAATMKMLQLLAAELPPKKACKLVQEFTGIHQKLLYNALIEKPE